MQLATITICLRGRVPVGKFPHEPWLTLTLEQGGVGGAGGELGKEPLPGLWNAQFDPWSNRALGKEAVKLYDF